MTPELRRKNIATAFGCLAFVGGVYLYSIRKLKDVSRLQKIVQVSSKRLTFRQREVAVVCWNNQCHAFGLCSSGGHDGA